MAKRRNKKRAAGGTEVHVHLGRYTSGLGNKWADQAWDQLRHAQDRKLKIDMDLSTMGMRKQEREFNAKLSAQRAEQEKALNDQRNALLQQQAAQRAEVLKQRANLDAERARQRAEAQRQADETAERFARDRLAAESKMAEMEVEAAKKMVDMAAQTAGTGIPFGGGIPHSRSRGPRHATPRASH